MMQVMRGMAGKIVMIAVAIVFGLWGLLEAVSRTDGTALGSGELGRVNGDPVTAQAYQATYQQLYEQARQQAGGQLSREQVREVENAAWDRLVGEILIRQELERRDLRASDEEIRQAILSVPHPALAQNELFLTDGQFDIQKYRQFLLGPTANEDLLLQLEQYYREAVPQSKLFRQIAAATYVSDAELWRSWQDRNETATVEYVALDPARLAPGEVAVSDAEVNTYYQEHEGQFERPATARVTAAVLPKTAVPIDTAAAYERARSIRAELEGGADFAAVARRESADPGSRETGGELGTFGRGQMVPAFEEPAFSLPVGEISQPVQTPFGLHLIQVQERSGDEVRARHILIPFAPSEEALDRLASRADSLEALAERSGLERAARAVGAQVRSGVTVSDAAPFIPGVGPALDALEWVRDDWNGAPEGDRPAVSELFETDQAYYLLRPESFRPAGTLPLSEAGPAIRRRLILDKKKEKAARVGAQLVREVRGGKPLQAAARERGLSVGKVGPFTRVAPNAVFGQANAAIGAAFGTPIGQLSGVVTTPAGVFVVRPIARTEADRAEWAKVKEQQRVQMSAQLQESTIARWLRGLRDEAEIVDRRAEVQRQG